MHTVLSLYNMPCNMYNTDLDITWSCCGYMENPFCKIVFYITQFTYYVITWSIHIAWGKFSGVFLNSGF